jgi:hypothetical protein
MSLVGIMRVVPSANRARTRKCEPDVRLFHDDDRPRSNDARFTNDEVHAGRKAANVIRTRAE